MSVLLKKLLWYPVNDIDNPVNLTDAINMDIARGVEIKNNVMTITLKGSPQYLDSSYNIVSSYVDETFSIKFNENDQIKFYVKYSDDPSEIESTAWSNTTLDVPSDDYLSGVFYVIEYDVKHEPNTTQIKLVCADKTYIMFSRLFAKAFRLQELSGTTTATTSDKLVDSGAKFKTTANIGMLVYNDTDDTSARITAIDSDSIVSISSDIFTSGESYSLQWTAPSIIQKLIRYCTEDLNSTNPTFTGTGSDSTVGYQVSALMQTDESGYIQDVRSDGSNFPAVSISKIWKPVYEWFSDLSQVEYTNTATEQAGTLLYGKPFIYYLDFQNGFHWTAPNDSITSEDDRYVIGTNTGIYNLSLQYKVFDTVNFVVGRGGEDLYGAGTLAYYFEPSNKVKSLRMRVVPMTDIAQTLIENEKGEGNIYKNNSGNLKFSGNSYSMATAGAVALWNNTQYLTESEYNAALRVEIQSKIENRAKSVVQGLINPRWAGSIETKGNHYIAGTLLNLTDKRIGINNINIRVNEIRHNIAKEGWFSTLNLEQDQDAIISLTTT